MTSVRLYGHVYDALNDFKREDETFNDALSRLLPNSIEVLEHPEEDTKAIWASSKNHYHLREGAGENVNMSEVIEFYLYREGVIDEISEVTVRRYDD